MAIDGKVRESEWARCAVAALDANGMNMSDLARKIQDSPQNVRNRLIDPRGRAPKGADLKQWADALHLQGDLRKRFMLLADLDRSPPFLRAKLTELNDRVERYEKALKAEQSRSKELTARVTDLDRKLTQALAELSQFLRA